MKESKDTNTSKLHIVGVVYQLQGAQLDKWLDTAVGRKISIMNEPENLTDPFAVSAWAWFDKDFRKVGYVGNEDRSLAHRLLLAYNGKRLHLKVTQRRENGTTLLAEVKGIVPVAEDAIMMQPKWEEWKTPVPPLPLPETIKKEVCIAEDVLETLKDEDCDADELRDMLEAYLKNSFYDLSLETRQMHGRIAKLLKQRPDAKDWRREINWLYGQVGRIGTESEGGKIWKKWMDMVLHPDFALAFAKGTMPKKTEVDEALYKFPMDLWGAWLNNRKKFFARIYYACIPRKVLWSFISTLALHEMMSCSETTNNVLQSWANQSSMMPDQVVMGFCTLMGWLDKNGYEISPIIISTLLDEVKRRNGKKGETKRISQNG